MSHKSLPVLWGSDGRDSGQHGEGGQDRPSEGRFLGVLWDRSQQSLRRQITVERCFPIISATDGGLRSLHSKEFRTRRRFV